MNIKNSWLTFIGVNKCNWNKKYKCYWKDNSIDILTLSELYFNFKDTSELNNLLRLKIIKEDKNNE